MKHLLHSRNWDYMLIVLTVLLLVALGIQSFIGTAYVWWAHTYVPGFGATGYPEYIRVMNIIAAPLMVLLVIAMGLCVPKRLFSRTALAAVSIGMLVAGIATWAITGSFANGVAAYLVLAGLIQAAVVAVTIIGGRAPSYFTQGRIIKIGSGLLHLGFIMFAVVTVALQQSAIMLPVFWTSTALMVIGSIMTFYSENLTPKRKVEAEGEVSF